MTDLMEQRAEEIFARIDRFGEGRMLEGVLAGIEQGWFQQQMADAAFRYQQQLEKGEKVIVGVNRYVTEDDSPWRSCASGRGRARAEGRAGQAPRSARPGCGPGRSLTTFRRRPAPTTTSSPGWSTPPGSRPPSGRWPPPSRRSGRVPSFPEVLTA